MRRGLFAFVHRLTDSLSHFAWFRASDRTCVWLSVLPVSTGWMARGQCKNVDLSTMYPERGQGGRRSDFFVGKAVCHGCPVIRECLEYALAHMYSTGDSPEKAAIGRYGVWGGTSPGEREQMTKAVA